MLLVGSFLTPSPTGELMIWFRIAFEFTAGCCLYAGWRWLGDRQTGRWWDIVGILALVTLVVALAFTNQGEGVAPLATLPLIALFVLACAGATGVLARLLGSRLMLWGGRVSYSVYMTHFIVLMVLGELLPPERFADGSFLVRVLVMAGYYVAAVAAGAACYYLVEEPARKGIRALLARRQRAALLPVREDLAR
jgi:peptidoglycan/LPS O-acetylase OafA/YrhL